MIIPKGHRVLIEQEDFQVADPVYASARKAGLELVHDRTVRAQESVDIGTVISIGATAWKDFGGEPWAEVGDKVVFAKFSGKMVEDPEAKDKHYTVINDEDVIAVIKG